MKKLSGDELAKEIGCSPETLKKTCMLLLAAQSKS
jgi:biotin operon repressor